MENIWTKEERIVFESLNSPIKIQQFLDRLTYNSHGKTNSPRDVIKNKTAHCFDGALFAAAALRYHGHKPLLMDLKANGNDDDHVLAIFKINNLWGSIGKSNFTTLRYREPVYRTLRELAMSYFDFYFNSIGEKTLRKYSRPLNLEKFDKYNWMTTPGDVDFIGDYLDSIKHFSVIDERISQGLNFVSPDILKAGLLGSDPEGLFKVE